MNRKELQYNATRIVGEGQVTPRWYAPEEESFHEVIRLQTRQIFARSKIIKSESSYEPLRRESSHGNVNTCERAQLKRYEMKAFPYIPGVSTELTPLRGGNLYVKLSINAFGSVADKIH